MESESHIKPISAMRTQFLPSGVMALKTQISFDLDGVLQQNPFRLGVFPHVCRALAPFIGAEEPEPETAVRRLILGEAKRRLLDGRHVEAYDWDDIVASVANALGARGAGAPDPANLDIAALVRHYCEVPGMIRRLPGACEALCALKEQGHPLIVISNGYHKYQLPVLKALAIDGFFHDIVTPEQAGTAKPAPGIFRDAWRSRLAAGTPIHVGDDLIHDAWGARAAGGYSVWLHAALPEHMRGASPEERPFLEGFAEARNAAYQRTFAVEAYPVPVSECMPHAVIWHLSELPALVARITGAGQ